MGAQSTERSSPPRSRCVTSVARYLFVVLEGARLGAGGLRIALAGVESLQIGRGAERMLHAQGSTRALEVPDAQMSGTHARIACSDAAVVLEDAGSTNGSRVNGAPIGRHELRDGDLVELGQTILLYREIEETDGRAASLDSSAMAGVEPGFATLDPRLARRLARLARVAPSALSILLLGETGTGKEVLARGLHALSGRPGPFVAVNCGAIPHHLVESQLFGHVRGAFSGALKDEPGLVRAAQYGTLLLDEIGDLPASSQAALLRVLQEGEVQPVGNARSVKVDVRVVAATNLSLATLIERGAFRRDLYARLAGYTFELLPLRERRVDLGLIIATLMTTGKLDAQGAIRMQNDVARALVRYGWPMNVRELEHCLRAACALAEDAMICAEDLPPAVLGVHDRSDAPTCTAATHASAAPRAGAAGPDAGSDLDERPTAQGSEAPRAGTAGPDAGSDLDERLTAQDSDAPRAGTAGPDAGGDLDEQSAAQDSDAPSPGPVGPDADGELGEQIAALLAEHHGNVSAVSRALRTSRSQIYRLIARHGATGKPS